MRDRREIYMRKNYSKFESLIAPAIEGLGFEFVGTEQLNIANTLIVRVYIDKLNSDKGVDVEDCREVNEQISAVLDVDNIFRGSYTLEVSSPGLDRKLFTVEQLAKQVGKNVKLKLYNAIDGRKNFNGSLTFVDVHKDMCTLDVNGTEVVFYLNDVDEARLIPEYKF